MTDRDSRIQLIIEQNPGIQFREIMRSSGLKNGVVKVIRGPRQARFYPPQITEDESVAIKALRKQTPRDLLLALVKDDGLEFSELVREVKKSPSTVSLYLSQLVENGLVEIRLVQLKKKYHIQARDLIDKFIEDYRPGLLEKPTSGFEDIINSF
jgi:DNA-binding transcriptional ArsR family regulator